MRVGDGQTEYQWTEDWAEIPPSESATNGWAHNGVAITASGDVISFHPGESTMMVFDSQGKLARSWQTDFTDAHGITIVNEAGVEYLWVADNGRKRAYALGYEYGEAESTGQAVKITLDGEIVQRLDRPDLPVYETGMYSPTSVAVNGANGDIWLADGYGQSYVHRYDSSGNYLSSINGEEGAGRFATPHSVFVDTRKADDELYVSDRANGRVQVYDMEGGFKRAFGSDYLTTPSAFAIHGDKLIIAELNARLAVVDAKDMLIGYLGGNLDVTNVAGWPNNLDAAGVPVRTSLLESGKFNSPHGLAVDSAGNIYVSEWLIGGRFIRLGLA
jgi:DNA-binding beta-propeller fold protein YncE